MILYTNIGRYEWMDRDIGCVDLDWDDGTSRHRPIVGFRRSRMLAEPDAKPIQDEDVGGAVWSRRVRLCYLEKLRAAEGKSSGVQRLLLMKTAVTQVTQQMKRERSTAPSVQSASCKLAWAMRYIRSTEKGNWRRAAEARAAFPDIVAKVGAHNDKV